MRKIDERISQKEELEQQVPKTPNKNVDFDLRVIFLQLRAAK